MRFSVWYIKLSFVNVSESTHVKDCLHHYDQDTLPHQKDGHYSNVGK